MLQSALVVVFVYWLVKLLDNITGLQSICRPIIVGPVTGLFLGDITTGVIMGVQLEAIYMGVSNIGGVIASDTITATIISTAFAILSGLDIETGMGLAVVIGTIMNSFNTIDKFVKNFFYQPRLRCVQKGDEKGFKRVVAIQALLFEHEFACILMFLAIYFGTDVVSNAIAGMPAWLINGFSVAANMMTAVGISMIAVGMWGDGMGIFVLVGFILSKYLGLSALVIAAVGVIIAVLMFKNELRMKELETARAAGVDYTKGGDDIYD